MFSPTCTQMIWQTLLQLLFSDATVLSFKPTPSEILITLASLLKDH